MECVATQASRRDGLLDVCAHASAGPPLRFQIPSAVLEWAPGQRFLFAVEPDSDAMDCGAGATSCVRLRGTVLTCGASSVTVSHGGLLLVVPRHLWTPAASVGDAVRTSLTPVVAGGRKRALRGRASS